MPFLTDILNFLGHNLFERLLSGALLLALAYLAYRWVLGPLSTLAQGVWTFWKIRKQSTVTLEITPPKHSEKQPLATEQLLSVMRRLIGKDEALSLQIDATYQKGVRYLVGAKRADMPTLQRQLTSYLPEARLRVLGTPIAPTEAGVQYSRVFEIKQAQHYAYPLQPQEDLSQGDPVNYIAGAMTKLRPGEQIAMQLVVTPHSSHWTDKLRNRIHSQGYAVIDHKLRHFILSRPIWVWLITVPYGLFTRDLKATLSLLLILLVVSLFTRQETPVLSLSEQELYANILAKLDQPLFRTDIRVLVSAKDNRRLYELSSGVASSLATLNTSGSQSLCIPRLYSRRMSAFKFKHSLPSLLVYNSNVFAASELASIYHFPYGTIQTEGMVRSHSRTLPATLAIKNNKFDVVLGQNKYHGEVTPLGLTATERERHLFIIGGTGNGKTTMLQYAIVQDIQNGKGVAVVDPHGDMAETLLRYIPEERITDVIYFNPDDLAHPIGLNLLELTPGLEGDELLREKDLITESVISIFRKIFSEDDTGGHRIEYVLRNAIQTALTTENPTLFTIFDLLNDQNYRREVVSRLDNKDLVKFWTNELGKAGSYQQVKMAAGITSKIGRFLFSASAKRILEQPRSTINFDKILDGKILICNFSKGLLGEDTSELLGTAILAKIQLAALRRARLRQVDRKPFYLYVDEFQNFATQSFVQMLSESRKYKLYLTMAEQSTSQQKDKNMVQIILANVGTIICFRTGSPVDEQLLLPLFSPYITEGEISNLSPFNFYARLSSTVVQEPLSGQTMLLPNTGSDAAAKGAIEHSRANFAKKQPPPSGRASNY